MNIEHYQLPCGLTLILDPIPNIYTVAVGAFIKAGARYETIPGLAHFLEHMVFKGTQKRSAMALTQEIENVGGTINAFTGREETMYYVRMMADDVEIALDILSDMLSNPLFQQSDLESERNVVIQEILQAEDTPEDVLFDNLQKNMFKDQSLGEPILGYQESLARIDAPNLRDFMQHHYNSHNIILSIAGHFDRNHIIELADKYFADLPQHNDKATLPQAMQSIGNNHVKRPIEQHHLCLALPGMRATDPETYTAMAFSEIFGETMSSRLFQKIREELGLAYSIQSFMQSYHDTGIFGVYAATSPDKAQDLQDAIWQELIKAQNSITENEVIMARKQMLTRHYMMHENTSSRMQNNAKFYHLHHKLLNITDIIEKINGINHQKIINFATNLCAGQGSWFSVSPKDLTLKSEVT